MLVVLQIQNLVVKRSEMLATTALEAVLRILKKIGTYSALKMNWQKRALMPLQPENQIDQTRCPLKVVSSFKYLGGITINPRCTTCQCGPPYSLC